MSSPNRQVFASPHIIGNFNAGEFIYDPTSPWETTRSGMIVDRGGNWFVVLAPLSLSDSWQEASLTTYSGTLGRNVLIDYSGFGPPRGPSFDPKPWLAIRDFVIKHLRDAKGRRLRLEALLTNLKTRSDLDQVLIEDSLRMMLAMGTTKIQRDAGGLWLKLSELVQSSFDRKDYLASFSDELLAKSRRIDNLVQHSGTVGTYREELLRTMIAHLLPSRYKVSTGFLESCPRQLDVIVWDTERYAPLFREGDVVVVPAAAVRAIVEVKTTLSTGSLSEALDILYEVLRVEQPIQPIFKGIFAFESNYASDSRIAKRIQRFHRGFEENGYFSRVHRYLLQGVAAVCVPNKHYVFQRYVVPADEQARPYPVLRSLIPEWPGDVRTGVFLGELLSYLDLEVAPKKTLTEAFMPIFTECRTNEELQLFEDGWEPELATALLGKTMAVEGAREYLKRFDAFRFGEVTASELNMGFSLKAGLPAEPDTTSSASS